MNADELGEMIKRERNSRVTRLDQSNYRVLPYQNWNEKGKHGNEERKSSVEVARGRDQKRGQSIQEKEWSVI